MAPKVVHPVVQIAPNQRSKNDFFNYSSRVFAGTSDLFDLHDTMSPCNKTSEFHHVFLGGTIKNLVNSFFQIFVGPSYPEGHTTQTTKATTTLKMTNVV